MSTSKKVEILYFTDVLCIWAYVAQIRMDELKTRFGDSIVIKKHFLSVFGSVEQLVHKNWAKKGGLLAYSDHVKEVASQFDHIQVNPDIWTKNIPATSASAHLFLKAIQLMEYDKAGKGVVELNRGDDDLLASVIWELRLAFFRDLVNVSSVKEQMKIAKRLDLDTGKIEKLIENGAAYAAMESDLALKETYKVSGSPTLIFNEGRQTIYGNVGYKVIEANIQELLNQPESQGSWC